MDVASMWKRVPGWIRWGLGAVGTLVVGGIVSGIGDVVVRPMLSWCLDSAYSVTLFGIESVRDSAYQQAAKGSRDDPAIFALALLTGAPVGVTGGILVFAWFFRGPRIGRKDERFVKDSFADDSWPPFQGHKKLFVVCLFIFVPATFGVFLFQALRVVYVTEVIGDFNQSVIILAPHLADQDEEILRARFASMTTGKQYDALVTDLKALAVKNGTVLPLR